MEVEELERMRKKKARDLRSTPISAVNYTEGTAPNPEVKVPWAAILWESAFAALDTTILAGLALR